MSDGAAQPLPQNQYSGAGEHTTPSGVKATPGPTQLPLALTWSGEVPSQKWMNFYTKFLTKLGVGDGLSLNVSVKCASKVGLSQQKLEEIKGALRELGLDDTLNNS